MRYQKSIRCFFMSFALFMTLILTACSTPLIQQGATPTRTPNTYGGDGIQKGPGSAALTATTLATPSPVTCQLPPLTTPANTQGWKMYSDQQFPFHFLYPADWKVGQTPGTSADGSSSWYQVMILPPTGVTPIVEESAMTEPEYIELTIHLTGPIAPFSNEATWTPENAPFPLNHIFTKLSYRFSPDCSEFNRATDPITFGQHAYSFYQTSRGQADKIKDSEIFLSIIQSFVYTGGH